MEQKKIHKMVSLLLIILFIGACSPAPVPPTLEQPPITDTLAPQPGLTQLPATAEGTSMPLPEAGLCANPYYPVRQGATWTYRSTGGPAGEYSFTDTITSVRDDGFTLSTQMGSLSPTQEWACRADGLVALQFGGAPAAMLSAQNMQLSFEINNATDVTFPSAINPGDQWQHDLDFEGSVTAFNEQGAATGSAQSSFTAVGMESVTVPAGTFEALKIEVDTSMNMNATYQGITLPVSLPVSYTYWFAPGIGWVKATGTASVLGTPVSETVELQSYNIP